MAQGVFYDSVFYDAVFWCGDENFGSAEFLLPAPIREWAAIEDGVVTTIKDGGATEDFTFDWTNIIGSATIVSHTWTVPMGVTKVSTSRIGNKTTIRLSSGTNDLYYKCPCTVTLSDARVIPCRLNVGIFPN